MSYPDPTVPTTIPVDISTPVTTTAHHVNDLAYTGGDVLLIVVIALIVLALGAMAMYTWRWNKDVA
jgi:hypothetical protein